MDSDELSKMVEGVFSGSEPEAVDMMGGEAKPEEPEAKTEEPEAKPETKPEEPEAKTETKPETKPEEPEAKPETKPEEPEAKTEEPEAKPETKPEEPETKPETKPEEPEAKPETKDEDKGGMPGGLTKKAQNRFHALANERDRAMEIVQRQNALIDAQGGPQAAAEFSSIAALSHGTVDDKRQAVNLLLQKARDTAEAGGFALPQVSADPLRAHPDLRHMVNVGEVNEEDAVRQAQLRAQQQAQSQMSPQNQAALRAQCGDAASKIEESAKQEAARRGLVGEEALAGFISACREKALEVQRQGVPLDALPTMMQQLLPTIAAGGAAPPAEPDASRARPAPPQTLSPQPRKRETVAPSSDDDYKETAEKLFGAKDQDADRWAAEINEDPGFRSSS